jgi:4-hydroxyproline epimerase
VSGPDAWPDRVEVVDSHTEGEPTRVVVEGWPQPEGRTMAERRAFLLARQDRLRQAVVCEPRGHAAVVGALLTPPAEPGSAAGVVFFNNAGALGMCGHGLIGVVRTLEFLGRLVPGTVRIDTPVGTVSAELEADGAVTIENVPAFCHARDVSVDVPGLGRVTGDVAWGGNWFFLTGLPAPAIELANAAALTDATSRILAALREAGITGRDDAAIDHVELIGPPRRPDADARSFVLCPGLAYDRSPCGTGTSAKMAVLAARGELAPGRRWRQESVTGSLFEGWLEERGGVLVPHVRGRAFVTGRTTLLFDPHDPFREGLPGSFPRPPAVRGNDPM